MEEKNKFYYALFFCIIFFVLLLVPSHKLDFPIATIDESFYGRASLIEAATNFRVWLGDRVYKNVVIGKSGWLIYTGELSADDYQNVIPFSEKSLELFQENLDALNSRYAEQGITLLIVVTPNKNTIYSEYVPDELESLSGESRLDQLLRYMDEYGETQILDLRPVLFEAKNDQQVYYRTDTHWNSYGAFIAYQEIMFALNSSYPDLHPYPRSSFQIEDEYGLTKDLTRMIGTTLISEDISNLVPVNESGVIFRSVPVSGTLQRSLGFSSNSDNVDLPRAVIFHDSFFALVNPLLKEHFSRAIFVPYATVVFDLGWVDEQKPDIVIIEFTERYIGALSGIVETKQ